MTTPRERLKSIQERLEARGVYDVKFTWKEGFEKIPLEDLQDNVARFLEAYLDGNMIEIDCMEKFEPIGLTAKRD